MEQKTTDENHSTDIKNSLIEHNNSNVSTFSSNVSSSNVVTHALVVKDVDSRSNIRDVDDAHLLVKREAAEVVAESADVANRQRACGDDVSLGRILNESELVRVKALMSVDRLKAKKLRRRLKNKKLKNLGLLHNNHSASDLNSSRNSSSVVSTSTVSQISAAVAGGLENDFADSDGWNAAGTAQELVDQIPDELHEIKQVVERFIVLEKTRGRGRDRGVDVDLYDSDMLSSEGVGEFGQGVDEDDDSLDGARLSSRGNRTVKEDAFADDEADLIDGKLKSGISKKKLKKLNRPTVSKLKQLCSRPEVVESWDVTAPDPRTLVFLKSYRNTVPVPAHWSHKRKYLQGKRGLEKTLFRLPHYIEETRIAEIRSAIEQKDAQKTLKQKMRERVRPRHRKMHIDYQVLHDAFFKYATKPAYTRFGDVYFEGKETEMQMRKYVAGRLSERAREALGMSSAVDPPPWLLNMQRYGPPPSYPNLVVPGVNAHIPEGAALGFQVNGWGRLPSMEQLMEWGVTPRFDEVVAAPAVEGTRTGGDLELSGGASSSAVLGASSHLQQQHHHQNLWGQLQALESSEDEEQLEVSVDEKMEEVELRSGTETPGSVALEGRATPISFDLSGLTSVGSTALLLGHHRVDGLRSAGMSSVTTGLETPQSVDISGFITGGGSAAAAVASNVPYLILEQQKATNNTGALFASDMIYRMPPTNERHNQNKQPSSSNLHLSSAALLGGTATPLSKSS